VRLLGAGPAAEERHRHRDERVDARGQVERDAHEGDPEEGKRVAPARDPAGHLVLASGRRLRGAQRRRRVERRHQLERARGEATRVVARLEAERRLERPAADGRRALERRREADRAVVEEEGGLTAELEPPLHRARILDCARAHARRRRQRDRGRDQELVARLVRVHVPAGGDGRLDHRLPAARRELRPHYVLGQGCRGHQSRQADQHGRHADASHRSGPQRTLNSLGARGVAELRAGSSSVSGTDSTISSP